MIELALAYGFACLALAFLLSLWRLVMGPSRADRILALDTITINAIALVVLFCIHEATPLYFEAALLIAMVGFVGTVAFCKFILRGDIVE